MSRKDREALVQHLYQAAFSVPREPRSPEYRRGVLDALRYRCGLTETLRLPEAFGTGTAAADAWFAGIEEGHARWREYAEKSS